MTQRIAKQANSQENQHSNSPSLIELSARHQIEACRQGELDCLCGLYSIVNAIRLACEPQSPLGTRQIRRLFNLGLEYLNRKRKLEYALSSGTGVLHWKKMALLLTQKLGELGPQLLIEYPVPNYHATSRKMFDWIEAGLIVGSPTLLHLGEGYEHYTTIAGIDEKRIHLFDSSGFEHISRTSCGPKNKRHIITPLTMMRFSLAMD